MPKLRCTLCGRVEEVPKWHPSLVHGPGEAAAIAGHICATCVDRVRAEAVHQQDPDHPPGGEV